MSGLSFGLPPSLFVRPSQQVVAPSDPYMQSMWTNAALTQIALAPYQDDIAAFGIYSTGGLADPKIAMEASAYRTGPGAFGYAGGLLIAASYGMFVAGTLGWLIDPLDLREGSFSEDFNLVGLEVLDPKMISIGTMV